MSTPLVGDGAVPGFGSVGAKQYCHRVGDGAVPGFGTVARETGGYRNISNRCRRPSDRRLNSADAHLLYARMSADRDANSPVARRLRGGA